jgi:hypothetical protein
MFDLLWHRVEGFGILEHQFFIESFDIGDVQKALASHLLVKFFDKLIFR